MNKLTITRTLILTVLAVTLGLLGSNRAEAKEIYTVEIGHINAFFDEDIVIDVLEKAKKGDIVQLVINSEGGYIDKGYSILLAMSKSEAEIHTYVIEAVSMAAIIATAGDIVYTREDSVLMFHLVRTTACLKYVLIGKYCILDLEEEAQQNYLEIFNLYSRPFLTDSEYEAMLDGKDIYITGKQVQARLK